MSIDAGSISSSIRIRLNELSQDIQAARAAIDNLGTEFVNSAEKYSTTAGKRYVNSLKTIATEMKGVEGAAKAGALSEQQAVSRLIDLRQKELRILQDKAVKEGTASADTVSAIKKTEGALSSLIEKQGLLSKSSGGPGLFDTFARVRDVMLGPLAAVKEVIGVFQSLKGKLDELENEWAKQAEAIALVDNTLRSTGASSWTTEKHLEELATSLQSVTKYGDETIMSMQAVLLGFRNITGKEFDHATKAVLDMATVMNMDLTSAAQAVGKALDNPAEGLDSLSRQGFKFTAEEKAMMKAMQDAGDIAGAQKIILDELDKTYGGAAEAVGSLSINLKERLKNAVGDVKEEMGRSMARGLAPYREWMIKVAQATSTAAKATNDLKDAEERQRKGISSLDDDLLLARTNYANLWKQIVDAQDYFKKNPNVIDKAVFDEGIDSLKAQAAAQLAIIDAVTKRMVADQQAAKASNEQAKKDAEVAKKKADEDLFNAKLLEERAKIQDEYSKKIAETNRLLKAGVLTEAEAADTRIQARKNEVDALAKLIEDNSLKPGLTTDLFSAVASALVEETNALDATTKAQEENTKANEDANRERIRQRDGVAFEIKNYNDIETALTKMTQSLRDKDKQISASGMSEKEKIEAERKAMLEQADAFEAAGHNVTELRNAINKLYDDMGQDDPEKVLKAQLEMWGQIKDYALQVISGIAEAYSQSMKNRIDELTEVYDAEKELVENNGKTEKEVLEQKLADAKAANDDEAIAEAEKNLKLYNINKDFEKKKADLQYKADLARWESQLAAATAEAAFAIIKIWSVANVNVFLATAMTALTAAATGAQIAAINASRPTPPKLATGGIVLPQPGGVHVIEAENGYPELNLNSGPSGREFLREFAKAIAAEVGTGSGDITIVVPLELDGLVIAQSTARRIRNNEVSIR